MCVLYTYSIKYIHIFTGKINITGLFSDCTMSNESDELYLKAKAEPNSKVKVVKKAKVRKS